MIDVKTLVRPNIHYLADVATAHRAATATAPVVAMNACESPFNAPWNRYPAPETLATLRQALAADKHVRPEAVLLTAGSFAPIDLFLRTFCSPQRDNIVLADPAPNAYARLCQLNDVECRRVRLDPRFDVDVQGIVSVVGRSTKAILLCSPNYPTGNLLSRQAILDLADRLYVPLLVDETFIDFSAARSLVSEISAHPNLVIVGSLSAAFSAAALDVGYAIAHPEVVSYLEIARPVHPLALPVIEKATELLLRRRYDVDKWVRQIIEEREKVIAAVKILPFCETVFPSTANFFMVRFADAKRIAAYLAEQGIAVADVSACAGCENCLNITIGLNRDNNALISALRKYPSP